MMAVKLSNNDRNTKFLVTLLWYSLNAIAKNDEISENTRFIWRSAAHLLLVVE